MHDPQCAELARSYLEDQPACVDATGQPSVPEVLVNQLADEIQETIEDWLEFHLPNALEAQREEMG